MQCLHRWQKVLNPELVKGPWTKEVRMHARPVCDAQEDDLVVELVARHGAKRWSLIASHLSGRIGKQCRERYVRARRRLTGRADGTTTCTRASTRRRGPKRRMPLFWPRTRAWATSGPRLPSCCPGAPTMRSRTIGTRRCAARRCAASAPARPTRPPRTTATPACPHPLTRSRLPPCPPPPPLPPRPRPAPP